MYNSEVIEAIAYVLRTLSKARLEEVGSVEGPWLNFGPIEVMDKTTVIGKIEYESEVGWFYIPIEAYKEEE